MMQCGKCANAGVALQIACDYGTLALLIRSTELLIISADVTYRPKRSLGEACPSETNCSPHYSHAEFLVLALVKPAATL